MPKTAADIIDFGQIDSLADSLKSLDKPGQTSTELEIKLLVEGRHQPRLDMDKDALNDLAASIKSQGILQPLLVRPFDDEYEIVFGHRRFAAAKIAKLKMVPCIVRDDIPEEDVLALALIENIDREGMSLFETASAVAKLVAQHNAKAAAKLLGKRPQWVSKYLAISKAPEFVKEFVQTGYSNDAEGCYLLAQLAKKEEASAREIIDLWETDPSARVSLRAQVKAVKNKKVVAPNTTINIPDLPDSAAQSTATAANPKLDEAAQKTETPKKQKKQKPSSGDENISEPGTNLPPIIVDSASVDDEGFLLLKTNEGPMRFDLSKGVAASIVAALS